MKKFKDFTFKERLIMSHLRGNGYIRLKKMSSRLIDIYINRISILNEFNLVEVMKMENSDILFLNLGKRTPIKDFKMIKRLEL